MIRSAVSKVMWVGRATVFVAGLAVILALVFGVATAAFGANGQAWILGKSNVASAITRLAGAAGVNGPMLQLINNNADANDTALDLRVQSGEAPMRVNSATKVANLNADKLDNKDSTDFATSTEASGFDYHDGSNSTPDLTTTTTNVASFTLAAPADGFVILTGSGVFNSVHTNGTSTFVRVYLTKVSGAKEFPNLAYQEVPSTAPSGTYSVPFSITRVFPVTAGEHTFYMTADVASGTSFNYIARHNLTGVFVKNQL